MPSTQVVADWSVIDSSPAQITRYVIGHDESNLIVGVEISAKLREHRNVFTVPFAKLSCLVMGHSDDGIFIDFKSAPNAVVHERAMAAVINAQVQEDDWQPDTTLSESLIFVDIDTADVPSITGEIDAMFDKYKPTLPINQGDCSPENL